MFLAVTQETLPNYRTAYDEDSDQPAYLYVHKGSSDAIDDFCYIMWDDSNFTVHQTLFKLILVFTINTNGDLPFLIVTPRLLSELSTIHSEHLTFLFIFFN